MKVTSQTIAELAGVSRGTVDRALNDRGQVKADVKKRILKIAEEMNYKPNRAARALVTSKRGYRIKLIIHNTRSNYWNEMKKYMQRAFREISDYGLALDITELVSDEPDDLIRELDDCLAHPPDYLVVAPYNTDKIRAKLQEILAQDIPLLTIDTTIEKNPSPCHIGTDAQHDGRIMAALFHFVFAEKKPQILVLYRYQYHLASQHRIDAFFKELSHLKQDYLMTEKAVITGMPQSSYHTTMKILEKYPELDAIFVASGNTEGVCNALIDSARNRQIKLFAYDITGKMRKYLDDGTVLATLCQSNRGIAEATMKRVSEELVFGRKPSEKMIITPNLIKLKQSPD